MVYRNQQVLLEQLNSAPERIEFQDIIAFIEANFIFTPTAFTNGKVQNDANQNNGSCHPGAPNSTKRKPDQSKTAPGGAEQTPRGALESL